MTDYFNGMKRKCSNCTFWTRKSWVNNEGERKTDKHNGYCTSLGKEDNIRFCYEDNDKSLDAVTPHFGLCDKHEFSEEHESNMRIKFKDDPASFEPKEKKNVFQKLFNP